MIPRIHLRSIYVVTLLAFLLNALLPFYALYSVEAAQSALLAQQQAKQTQDEASLFGDKVFICTADGFKWVSWAELQNSQKQPKEHPQYKCALCYVAAQSTHTALPTGAIAIIPRPLLTQVTFASHISYRPLPQMHRAGHLTRAPPHSIA